MKVQDQTNMWLSLDKPPKRVVSLVPSISELIVYMGLEEELVGVTRFCTHPAHLRRQKTIVGGTKDPNLDIIADLNPDIIVANKEENLKEHIELLKTRFPVYVSDVNDITDNLNLICSLGKLLNRAEKADELHRATEVGFETIKNLANGKVLYVIWQDPIMVAGKNTIIDSVLTHCGFSNLIAQRRYPQIAESELKLLAPDYVFLSSEPYPFKEKNKKQWENVFPKSRIILVDGRAFSWYGYCFVQTPKYIQKLWSEIQM